MRIGLLSDSHGDYDSILKGLKEIGECNIIIHAGDKYDDAIRLARDVKKDVISVKGNTDFFCKGPTEELVNILGKRILITHGHNYNVKQGLTSLYYKALEEEADIVIFGHSHIPLYIVENNITFINPGSTSRPRGGSNSSCGILEIKDNNISVKIKKIV